MARRQRTEPWLLSPGSGPPLAMPPAPVASLRVAGRYLRGSCTRSFGYFCFMNSSARLV